MGRNHDNFPALLDILKKNCHELSDMAESDGIVFYMKDKKLYVEIRCHYIAISLVQRHEKRLTVKQRLLAVPEMYWGEEWLE
jgi:hypothetical protein